jgi:hypothetical protein
MPVNIATSETGCLKISNPTLLTEFGLAYGNFELITNLRLFTFTYSEWPALLGSRCKYVYK